MFKRAFVALSLALLAAGCAQEGKLIDVPLAVRGVALDQNSIVDGFPSIYTTRFKVQVHATNSCERKHVLLELSRTGPSTDPIYIIKPVARYNADDACLNDPAGPSDTTVILTVNPGFVHPNQTPVLVYNTEGPVFSFVVDTTYFAPAKTVRFRVKVEDKTSGDAVAGASVQLDSLAIVGGGAFPIGSPVLTDGTGFVTIDVTDSTAVGKDAFRYQVTVTSGANVNVMPVRGAAARGGSIERVFIRL